MNSTTRAPAAGTIVAGAHLLLALVYAAIFAARYGYSPLIVPLHVAQVALGCVVVGLLIRSIAARAGPRPSRRTRWLIAIVGATASSLYLVILIGCAVTNEAWGWSVSLSLAREYASSLPAIIGNLPFSRGWLYAGATLYIATKLAILAAWWRVSLRFFRRPGSPTSRRPRSTRSRSFMHRPAVKALLPAVAVLATATFIAIARYSPRAAAEPFTALLTAPGLPNPSQARARNLAARRAYSRAYAGVANFDHRNVVLIFADALRADHTSVYGYARKTTPFLDSLATTGRLRRVQLAMSTCSFTACGILSTLASRDTRVLEPGSLKVHDILHDLGYRVNFIASTDNSSWYTLRVHYGQTVDYFFDAFNSKRFALNDDRSAFEALDAVPAATGPAFFFFFLSSTTSLGDKLPQFQHWLPAQVGADGHAVQSLVNAYDNGILEADNSIQRIFGALDQKGYLKNSIVVILGDHGEGFGEHGHFAHTKYLYQEVLHIPLLIYDDSDTTYRNLEFASQSDIAPTVLDRLGLPIPPDWQGHSLLTADPKSFSTHWTDRGRPWHAVVYRTRGQVYKYLYQTRWGALSEELYELVSDPGEHHNLISLGARPELSDILSTVRRKAETTFSRTPQ